MKFIREKSDRNSIQGNKKLEKSGRSYFNFRPSGSQAQTDQKNKESHYIFVKEKIGSYNIYKHM